MLNLKYLRIKMHPELHREFQLICIENRLSMVKQFNELVRKFVEIQKQNLESMKKIRRN